MCSRQGERTCVWVCSSESHTLAVDVINMAQEGSLNSSVQNNYGCHVFTARGNEHVRSPLGVVATNYVIDMGQEGYLNSSAEYFMVPCVHGKGNEHVFGYVVASI